MVSMQNTVRFFAVIFLVCSLSIGTFAQEPEHATSKIGPRKQIATIVFSGLAGAILGLSTLSFYGRPQDYLSNIAIGFAVGIIGGTVLVTYKAAAKPEEFYGKSSLPEHQDDRIAFLMQAEQKPTPQLQLRWSY